MIVKLNEVENRTSDTFNAKSIIKHISGCVRLGLNEGYKGITFSRNGNAPCVILSKSRKLITENLVIWKSNRSLEEIATLKDVRRC